MVNYKRLFLGVGFTVTTALSSFLASCAQSNTAVGSVEKGNVDNPPPVKSLLPSETETTATSTTSTVQDTPVTISSDDSNAGTDADQPPQGTNTPVVIANPTNYHIDVSAYNLVITGLVNTPLSLSYAQLLTYPAVTQNAEIVCPDTEDEWDVWTGVPLTALLKEAGLDSSAGAVIFTGVDGYYIQLPLETVLQSGVFLAYQMNGAALTPERGFPLRLVVTGSLGNDWLRWVTKIEVRTALTSFTNLEAGIQLMNTYKPAQGSKLCACKLVAGKVEST